VSAHEAAEALRELGLSNYEAKVFVALQQLGAGDAQEIGRVSDVPRSQVYGAADDLATRGLVEVVESSPKAYRPVSLETARDQLRARMDRQQRRAFENLDLLRDEQVDRDDEGGVATLRGHAPVFERVTDLVTGAERLVLLVGVHDDAVTDDLAAAVRDRAEARVDVTLVADDPSLEDRFDGEPIHVVVTDGSAGAGSAGRALVVDEATALLAVPTGADYRGPADEVALWTADTSIGRILVRFVHAGVQFALDDADPLPTDADTLPTDADPVSDE